MAGYQGITHLVVTPSRNEIDFLPKLVDSMIGQTVTPDEWIIVSHNSDESSSDYLEEICDEYSWIHNVVIEDKTKRRRGPNRKTSQHGPFFSDL